MTSTVNTNSLKDAQALQQLLAKLESVLEINRQLETLRPAAGQIERRERISQQEFLQRYYATNTPVILTGMMQDWPALSRWCPEYLQQHYGGVTVEIQANRTADPNYEINSTQHKQITTLGAYADLVVQGGESNDYYLVANNGNLDRPELAGLLDDLVLPDFLDPQDIPNRVFFWFGPAGAITPLHHDPLNLMMAHVYGRKRWRLISPNCTPLLYNYVGVFSQVDLECPDYEKYPLFQQAPVIETVLQPGEIIFVPVGWWHQVKSLDISLAVSCTNFVFPNSYNHRNPNIALPAAPEPAPPAEPAPPPRTDELTYEGVKGDRTSGYLVDRAYPNHLLMISFGFVDWDGTPDFDFYGRSKKLENLAATPINRILLRDFEQAWYHRGVRGLGEGIHQVRDQIYAQVQRLRPSRIVTVGQSMGAYAAILFGQMLNVDQILAFGPLSCLDEQVFAEFEDYRWLSVAQQLQANPPINRYFDLTKLPLASPNPPRLDIFYGQKPDPETVGNINPDEFHAQRLKSLPNCHLHPYAESGHTVVQHLIEHRKLDPILFDALFDYPGNSR
jgi:hypothetical protein